MSPTSDLPVISFASAEEWRSWIESHQADQSGLWIKIARKGTGVPSVTHDEALDVALCFGWIDAQRKGLDDQYFLQRFCPRRPTSKWSKRNRDKVERLIASGQMTPAGLGEVERAKADGRWDAAYDGPANMKVPDDLAEELAKNEKAKAFFDALNSSNRYSILYRIHDAKRPETRTRRIEKFVGMLERGEKPIG
jgi:uncharacterized protein YdeI (YjbR/CyaY-like superfamily)